MGHSWLDQAGFGDDLMNTLIVRFDGDVIDDLKIEGDADSMRATFWMSEKAVVVAAAAAEACAIAGEGEAGDEDDVERGNVEELIVWLGFPDVHLPALEIIEARDLTWLEFLMVDLKKG